MEQDFVIMNINGKKHTFDLESMKERRFGGSLSIKIECLSLSTPVSLLVIGSEYSASIVAFGKEYKGDFKYSGSVYSRISGFYKLIFSGSISCL